MRVRVQGMPTPSHFPPLAQIQNCWWAWDLWQSCHCWNSQPYLTPVHSCPPLPYQLTLHSIDRSSRWLEMPAVNQLSSLAGQTTNNKPSCQLCLSISIISANIHGSVLTCVSISSFLQFPIFILISSFHVRAFRPTLLRLGCTMFTYHFKYGSNSKSCDIQYTNWLCHPPQRDCRVKILLPWAGCNLTSPHCEMLPSNTI